MVIKGTFSSSTKIFILGWPMPRKKLAKTFENAGLNGMDTLHLPQNAWKVGVGKIWSEPLRLHKM